MKNGFGAFPPTRWPGCLVVALGLWMGIAAARAESAPSDSAAAAVRSWYQRQRAHYFNAPLVRAAERLAAQGDYAAAEALLDRALANEPDDLELQLALAAAFRGQEEWAKAMATLEDALAREPGAPRILLGLAEVAFASGQHLRAADYYGEAIAAQPDLEARCDVLRGAALSCGAAGCTDYAMRYARAWLEKEETPDAHRVLAAAAASREDWPLAIRHFERVATLAPSAQEQGEAAMNLGILHERAGDLPAAKRAYLAAADLLYGRAEHLEIRRQLGQMAYRQGDYADAARFFKTVLLEVYDEDIALGYVNALERSGQIQLALLEASALTRPGTTTPAAKPIGDSRQKSDSVSKEQKTGSETANTPRDDRPARSRSSSRP